MCDNKVCVTGKAMFYAGPDSPQNEEHEAPASSKLPRVKRPRLEAGQLVPFGKTGRIDQVSTDFPAEEPRSFLRTLSILKSSASTGLTFRAISGLEP